MSFFQGRWSAFTADITKKKKADFFHGFPFNFSAPPQPYLVPLVVKPRRPLQHLLIFLFEPTSSLPTPFLQRPATTDNFLLRLSLGKKYDYISLLQLLLVVYLFLDFLVKIYIFFLLGFGYLQWFNFFLLLFLYSNFLLCILISSQTALLIFFSDRFSINFKLH